MTAESFAKTALRSTKSAEQNSTDYLRSLKKPEQASLVRTCHPFHWDLYLAESLAAAAAATVGRFGHAAATVAAAAVVAEEEQDDDPPPVVVAAVAGAKVTHI